MMTMLMMAMMVMLIRNNNDYVGCNDDCQKCLHYNDYVDYHSDWNDDHAISDDKDNADIDNDDEG